MTLFLNYVWIEFPKNLMVNSSIKVTLNRFNKYFMSTITQLRLTKQTIACLKLNPLIRGQSLCQTQSQVAFIPTLQMRAM